ncbi:cytochrome c1 [Hydrogenophaga sp.]|uniref:cytochrome c1 n=1 Tax=Hydrogenophaga sp. TaxID=1904254 RepID=UPI002720F283|nr:cytochrome c1 [Hydrogenophaga sp.]MDO9135628.1 cytochrome c1 [Hydrogenophaga sp.]MDO9604224.1 cytochrome c1 [Hydrogenophaga sp.]MDP2164970.1 cytochrome c1 [Hydrogenophaga sp.]MDP3477859.1 cytochrome c1 [Hydrogenophaga sp.]
MKKVILGFMLALGLSGATLAAGPSFPLDKAPQRTNDMAALQNGAKLFVNYCLSCHSASFMRYNRLRDIGLNDKQIAENLTFTTDRIGDTMKSNMDPVMAKKWFGVNPPDLTLVARSRSSRNGPGHDYLYTLLRSYYRDDAMPTGWNNLAFPNIGMPNPLWELQGERQPIFENVVSKGQEVKVHTGWEPVKAGTMSASEFDNNVGDLVAYLQWMAEPEQNNRVRIGVWVMLFLSVFTVVAWRLNAAFWKDIK